MNSWHISQADSTFSNFANDWDNLNKQLYQRHPLLDSRFTQALIQHFGDQNIKLAVYGSTPKKLQNFLLLQQRRMGIWTTFLPSQAQIAPILCSHPESLPSLFNALPGYSISVDLLSQDPDFSFQLPVLSDYDLLPHATTMNVELQGTFEEYWQQRSKNLQQNIRRYFRRLEKNNLNFHLVSHIDSNSLEEALIRYGNMETQSWKGAEGTAIHHSNQQGQFYFDVLESFAKTKQAEITELYFNNQLAASRIIIFNQEMLIILKTTYNKNLSKNSPGRLLLYLIIEREFALKRAQKIEFYTNATEDQLSWSTNKRSIQHITMYRSKNFKKTFNLLRQLKNLIKN